MSSEDRSNVFFEECLDNTTATDFDVEGVMEKIFDGCDLDNTGYTAVSTLIKYLEPYMQENLKEIDALKSLLDPIGIDPQIDKAKFCTEMRKWSESHRIIEEANSPPHTPRKSNFETCLDNFRSPLLSGSFEDNLKTIYSCGSTPSPITHQNLEKSLELQTEIDNLKRQNRKLHDDLQDLRSQLVLSEESNANLQSDILRISKRLEVEQHSNHNLQRLRLECEELRESESNLKRNIERLDNKNSILRSENNQLKRKYEELEDEKIQLSEKLETYRFKNNENSRFLTEARNKVAYLKEQLIAKEDCMKDMEDKFTHYEDKIKDLENTISFLRAEKDKIIRLTPKFEKSFKENIDNHHLQENLRFMDPNMYNDQSNRTYQLRNDNINIVLTQSSTPLGIKNIPFKHIDTPYHYFSSSLSPIQFVNHESPLCLKRVEDGCQTSTVFNNDLMESNDNVTEFCSPSSTITAHTAAHTFTINKILNYSAENLEESIRDLPQNDTVYSIVMDPRILQNTSLLNELKEVTNDEIGNEHIKCSNKIKYLEGKLNSLEDDYNKNLESMKSQEAIIKKYESQSSDLDILIINLKEELKNMEKCLKDNSEIIHKHEVTISEKDSTIQEIQTEIQKLEKLNKFLIYEKEKFLQEKKSFDNKLECMKRNYEIQIVELQAHLEQLEVNLQPLSTDSINYHRLKVKLQNVTNNLHGVIERYEDLKLQNYDRNIFDRNIFDHSSDDEEVIKTLKTSAISFEKQIHICNQKIASLKRDADEKSEVITKLNERIQLKSREIEDLKVSMTAENRAELEQLKKLNTEQEDEILGLKTQLQLKQSELDQKLYTLNRQQLQIEQLNNVVSECEELREQIERLRKIERKHKMCPRYFEQIKNLRSQICQKDKEIEKLLENKAINEPCKHELEALIFENNKLKTEYESMHSNLTKENFELQTRAQNESEEAEKCRKRIECLTRLVKQTENELSLIQKNCNDLEAELKKFQLENDKLKKMKKDDVKMQSMENCSEIKSLNRQLQESLKVPSCAQFSGDNNCGNCRDLQSELVTYKLICMKQEEKLALFKNECNDLNPRPESGRSRNDWAKINPRTKLSRKIEILEDRLELESTKNEELVNVLDRIESEKSKLQTSQSDYEMKFKEEVTKFKSYLEETSSQLQTIIRQTYNTKIEDLPGECEADIDVLPFSKERYYEAYYVMFNRNLCRFIQILMNKNQMVKDVSHVAIQIPDSFSRNIVRTHSSLQKQSITLKPAKFSVSHRRHRYHSVPPTPIFRSIFGLRSSPIYSKYTTKPNEEQTMAEPCSFETPKLDNQLHKTILEMNNNVSPDSPASLDTTLFPSAPSNQKTQNKSENNILAPSSQMEGKVESTTSNDLSGLTANTGEDWSIVKDTVRRFSNMSISASSTNSGSTESLSIDNEHTLTDEVRHTLKMALDMAMANSKQHSTSPAESEKSTKSGILRARSKSQSLQETEQVELFPSIPDTFLENLDLQTKPEEETKEDLCEQDEIERKFMALSLAFTTDASTLVTRKERLQKFQDQAEQNVLFEVERLMNGIHKLNPLCIDAERTELVTSLITRVEILMLAARQSWNTSQCFGAVQQEWRLSESVKLMLKYVENVKLQRDLARRHFQYTRRMLQESTSAETPKTPIHPKTVTANSSNSSGNSSNNRLITRRRASIATISRTAAPPETLRTLANRRPSPSHADLISRRLELPERLSPAGIRSTRQSRAELGVGIEHLQNIHENMEAESSDVSDYDGETANKTSSGNHLENSQVHDTRSPNPYALMICNFFRRYCGDSLHTSGLLHEICVTGALIFFFIAAMQLGSVLLEVEYARRGIPVNHIPWTWTNWDEVLQVLFNWNSSDGPRPM